MASPSVAAIDTLNSLLEAEANSIFNFVGESSPYLDHATPTIRTGLETIRRNLDRHEAELAAAIRKLGGSPSKPATPDPEDQYLSFLSLRFLLPKLIDAKKLMIDRYDHALTTVSDSAPASQLIQKHIREMREDLALLKQLNAELTKVPAHK